MQKEFLTSQSTNFISCYCDSNSPCILTLQKKNVNGKNNCFKNNPGVGIKSLNSAEIFPQWVIFVTKKS